MLLPSQLKYGARLIGRWLIDKDEKNTEVFAMWEYDSYEDYERIESQIKSDKEHVMKVQKRFDQIGRERLKQVLKEDIKQEFVKSTVTREKTILN
ncbi:NIPSNAP family protein [Paenibacillus crassostreae]|uniref:NIPSNAP family protein n=1 Tax=Paenibacillus crassostreae TaxID=1763538 RepID=UPI001F48AA2B|nr:NIPSNAP family protein [Paenibacillus crassostreae]